MNPVNSGMSPRAWQKLPIAFDVIVFSQEVTSVCLVHSNIIVHNLIAICLHYFKKAALSLYASVNSAFFLTDSFHEGTPSVPVQHKGRPQLRSGQMGLMRYSPVSPIGQTGRCRISLISELNGPLSSTRSSSASIWSKCRCSFFIAAAPSPASTKSTIFA